MIELCDDLRPILPIHILGFSLFETYISLNFVQYVKNKNLSNRIQTRNILYQRKNDADFNQINESSLSFLKMEMNRMVSVENEALIYTGRRRHLENPLYDS